MHSILFYSILFYSILFYLECILTRNERRDEKGFSGIDSHCRGDRDKSTSSVISLNLSGLRVWVCAEGLGDGFI